MHLQRSQYRQRIIAKQAIIARTSEDDSLHAALVAFLSGNTLENYSVEYAGQVPTAQFLLRLHIPSLGQRVSVYDIHLHEINLVYIFRPTFVGFKKTFIE